VVQFSVSEVVQFSMSLDSRLGIGRWQSVLLVELDGPRRREVLLQLIDTGGPSPSPGSDSMLGAAS
jgi:hypothetical protein